MTVNNGNRIRFNAKYLQLKNKFSKLAPMRVKIALALVAVFLLGIPLLTVANPEVFQNLTQQVQEQLNPASDITIPEHTDAPAAYLADYLVDTIPFDGEEGVSLETTTLTLWFDRDMSEFAELANIPALVEQITIDSGATLEIEEATWLDRPSYPHSLFIIPLVLADVETEHTVSFAAASSEAESLEEGTEEEAEPIFSFSFTTEGALIAEDEEAEEAENLSPPYALEVIEASQEATAAYQEIVPLAATATAEINKVLHTPANEPTPNLNFTFLVQRHSFLTAAGAPGPLTNLPPIGEMDGDTGRVVLNINATNGSPTTSGTTTTLRRALNILEGITFATPGTYIWHVSELDGSSNSSGRFNVEYSDAVYELRVVVTGSGASATATVHFVAIVEDQAATVGAPMFSWGNNSSGQLGLGDTTNRNRPTRVGTADNWVQASSFAGGSIAINAEGHLYVWGGPRNAPNMGRGGLGGTAPITSPERLIIPGAASDVWVNVDGGGSGVAGAQPADGYMAAVNDAGEMWVWGLNAVGQLGLGNTTTQNTPQRVPGAQAWAQVNVVSMSSDLLANRRSFVLAITKDGHLYSWGNNSFSQLGRTPGGANPAANVPGRVNNPAGVPATFRWEMARPGGIGTAFAIGNDGQIYSWGTNADRGAGWGDGVGILGRPGANSTTPTLTQANAPDSPATHVSPPVTGWIDVVQQVNDPRATVALSDCGRLFSWGAGTSATVAGLGRPGGGAASATRTNRPVQIGTASNWVAIGGGNAHTVAMTSDGRLYSWGANASGQLGQGNFTAHPNSPQFVMQTFGLAGFSQTGSGTSSFALVRTDPMVFTNVYTVTHPDTVTTRADLTKVLRQLAGQTVSTFSFDFAIERWSVDGDLTRANELPQLGTSVVDGNGRVTIAMNAPDVMVETESGISTLTRSINILSGIEFDGPGVFVWRISEVSGSSGATPPSQVTYSDALYELTVTVTEGGGVLTAVATMEAIVADISGGVAGARAFPMYSWGNNNNGQLGLGNDGPGTDRNTPTRIGTEDNWVQTAIGADGSFAINTEGELFAWGSHWNNPQMGQGGVNPGFTGNVTTPTRIGAESNWVQVTARSSSAAAINANGEIFTWGNSAFASGGANTPTQVGVETNWVDVAMQTSTFLAINDQGHLYSWGANASGQLGLGDTSSRSAPTRVPGDQAWERVVTGGAYVLALTESGEIWAWGNNAHGQLGQDDIVQRNSPYRVGIASDWTHIAAATTNASAAINSSGELFTWGQATGGRLGNGTTSPNVLYPTRVEYRSDWEFVTSANSHFLAFAATGELYSWGLNGSGQLGLGDTVTRNVPTLVLETYGFSGAARGGGTHSLMLMNREIPNLVFTNTHIRTSPLATSKTVVGELANLNQDFTFDIELSPSALCSVDTTLAARVYQGPTFIRSEVFEPGASRSIDLRHGQRLSFSAVPVGVTWNVTERAHQSFTSSVVLYVGGSQVTIPPGAGPNVSLSTGDRVIGEGRNSADFTNTHHYVPITGLNVTAEGGMWIVALAAVVLTGVALVTKGTLRSELAAPATSAKVSSFLGGKHMLKRVGSLLFRNIGK